MTHNWILCTKYDNCAVFICEMCEKQIITYYDEKPEEAWDYYNKCGITENCSEKIMRDVLDND